MVYTGDPNEVVQNVSFGDIDLSLPATEFVSYNKQLFGIRADIKYKGLKATFIGSRTKGTTKTKQFYGNTQFVGSTSLDTSYIRRQYYDLTFGNAARLPIQAGTERIFLAQQIRANTTSTSRPSRSTTSPCELDLHRGTSSSCTPGRTTPSTTSSGILTFRNPLDPQFVVAVDFIDNGAASTITSPSTTTPTRRLGTPQARQDLRRTLRSPPRPRPGYNRELKTFLHIGQTQIVRDDGRGNFVLKVLDQNRVEVGPELNPVQKYPETIIVDFENGVFQPDQPFSVVQRPPPRPRTGALRPTPIIQAPVPRRVTASASRPSSWSPTSSFSPRSCSSTGSKLTRNVDYFIDYEAGLHHLLQRGPHPPDSGIDISYEVAPFAGTSPTSPSWARASPTTSKDHFSMGSTLLYQAGVQVPHGPDVTELAKQPARLRVRPQDQEHELWPPG